MKIFTVLTLLLVFVLSVFPQSGRRITTPATPVATTKVIPEDTYSESRPYKPRRLLPPNYRNAGSADDKDEGAAASSGSTDGSDEIINVDSSIVTIPVAVYDKNGLYISDIRQDEIKVFEDGKEQEIAYFGVSEKPFTVALLIDTSPSTEYKIEEIRSAAKTFVSLLKPEDRVLVMEFDNDPSVLTEATTNRQAIYRGIDKADFGNGTALYDAVDHALNRHLNKIAGRKAIVLFTDGVDTVSKRSYDSTLNDAEESGTIVFPIYYNTYSGIGGGGGAINSGSINGGILPGLGRNQGYGSSPEEYALGKRYLDDLAAYTGGSVFQPDKSPGGLMRAFEGIAEELSRQYNLAYYPSSEGKKGQRKTISVRVY
ncbi:MAG: VWA domain-containing protein, partial [Acidobacteria bacterium]|nr:VWA domain-containing protein [Acidobacteriota bacterium]